MSETDPTESDNSNDADDRTLPAASRIAKSGNVGVTMLSAAMLGLGEFLEPNKTTVEIEQPGDPDSNDHDGFDFSFGDLPPLYEL